MITCEHCEKINACVDCVWHKEVTVDCIEFSARRRECHHHCNHKTDEVTGEIFLNRRCEDVRQYQCQGKYFSQSTQQPTQQSFHVKKKSWWKRMLRIK